MGFFVGNKVLRKKRVLTVGNIIKDMIIDRDGERREEYGGSLYASVAASRLDCESHLLARGNNEIRKCLKILKKEQVTTHRLPDKYITFFVNDYSSGYRKQTIPKTAGRVFYPPRWDRGYLGYFDIVILNPIYQEISPELVRLAREDCSVLALDVQGLVREADPITKEVSTVFWKERKEYLSKKIDVLKIGSDEIKAVSELDDKHDVCKELYSLGADVVALTFGEAGSLVYDGKKDEFHKILACPVHVVDETGAGDVYTAAFSIRYSETKDVLAAGLFASAAASFVVEAFGYKNIATIKKVEERYEFLNKKHSEV